MTNGRTTRQSVKRVGTLHGSVPVPHRMVEYAYYALILYGLVGDAWGLSIPFVAAGGLAFLAMYCVLKLRDRLSLYKSLVPPLGCAISFIIIQVAFHGESLLTTTSRGFVNWIFELLIVGYLGLRRGFFNRFAWASLIIGAVLIPYLALDLAAGAEVERIGLESSIGISNPNDLAGWFGFLVIYFAILGIESKHTNVRFVCFFIAAACLFVIGLTVSRSVLVGVAIALAVGSRRLLKRGFIPVLCGIIIGGVCVFAGLFDQIIGSYAERGMEETGRFLVWPLAISRFLASPIIGVGASESGTYVFETGNVITPHNSFLYFALTAGVVPFLFYLTYWIKAARAAYQWRARPLPEAPFQFPLFIYSLIIVSFGAGAFMFHWVIVTVSTAMLIGAPSRGGRVIARWARTPGTVAHSQPRSESTFSARGYGGHRGAHRGWKTS